MTCPDSRIELCREFPASRERVFRALSEPEFVQRWFFPDREFVLRIEQFDFVPHGQYRFSYQLPDRTVSKVHGQFLTIRRPELVEFTWTWEPPDPHADVQTLVTWRLEAIPNGTRFAVTHERLPDDYLPMFGPGWMQTIQHLAELLESLHDESNESMSVDTTKVQGRRQVRYGSYADLVADAEQLAAIKVTTLGNWSYGQILKHLAQSTDSSIDGSGFALPAPVRWIFTLLMKGKYLTQPIPAGFKAPKQFQPQETNVDEALALLRNAITRQEAEEQRAMHPAFGMISKEEWTQFNLRHAEMHMSFVVPEGQA